MSIYKIKGSPYFWYDFTIGGVRFRDSTKTDKRKEALAIYAKRRSEAVIGQHYTVPGKMTLNEAFAKYAQEHAQHLKSWENSVEGHIRHILGHFGKNTWMQNIGMKEMESYIAKCRTTEYRRQIFNKKTGEVTETGNHMIASPATINRRIAIFRGMHNKARTSWDVQVQNINFGKLRLAEPEPPNNPLSHEEAEIIIAAAPEHLLHYIMFTIYTGLRRTNVLELGKDNLDMQKRTITVYGKSRKPGGKIITALIPDVLYEHIKKHELDQLDYCITYQDKPIRRIYTSWKNVFKETGIKYRRPHDLRHTFGTWLYANTKDILLVKQQLHHVSLTTTMRYTHGQDDKDFERVNKAFAPKSRQTTLKRVK